MFEQISSTDTLELLREEGGLSLYRVPKDAATRGAWLLLLAEGTDAESRRRLDNEYEQRESLDPQWAVMPVRLIDDGRSASLWLSDPAGDLLANRIGRPWQPQDFLPAAIGVVQAVRRMHAAGLIHRDLKPGNILLEPTAGQAWLTGFAVASCLPRERHSLGRPERLAGTLAYMSPEQTGRMNRSMDSRSDLYSLGVVFYEMLSGGLPFQASDPLEWIHCHIARAPVPLSELRPDIPASLSAIVGRLLAKSAEERYQTAAGLELDLLRCLEDWRTRGDIGEFRLGTRDHSGRLVLPERLYGRDREIEALLASFSRVCTDGRCEVTLVSGYSGIGKSSLVNELHKRIVPPRGIFISGKFDQRLRDTPYSTVAAAFRGLLQQILAGESKEVEGWRDQLARTLDGQGSLLVDVLPELVVLLGPQAPMPPVSAGEAATRFHGAFAALVGAFARAEHPLVLFLDDLQWFDPATLALLERIAVDPQIRYLHIVGAFRDNEVGAGHPLLGTVAAMRASGVLVWPMTLDVLAFPDVNRFVADALRIGTTACRELAEAAFVRTGGNPFFIGQFLATLEEDGLLRFDPSSMQWAWDMRGIAAKGLSDNLAELMVGRLRRLPSRTRDALKLLSSLGGRADLEMLAIVDGSERALRRNLRAAVDAGVLLVDDGRYRFLHDRVQEAAYALIDLADRGTLHLKIALALVRGLSAPVLADRIFDVANQFNAGLTALGCEADRLEAAGVNLQAALKAKASTAYDAACRYLDAGARALGEDGWNQHHDMAFALCFERAECEISRSRVEDAAVQVNDLIARARAKVDLARAYTLRLTLQIIRGEMASVARTAHEALRVLGLSFPPSPTRDDMCDEYDAMTRAMADRSIESLADLPIGSDPEVNAAMGILMQFGLAAYLTDASLYQTIACRIVQLSLAHGLFDASTFGFACVGISLGPEFQRFADGERFARVAVAITRRGRFPVSNAGAYVTLQQAVIWTRPVDEALACLDIASRIAKESGSLIFACYAIEHRLTNLMFRGETLDSLMRGVDNGLAFAERNQFRHVGDIIASMRGFIEALHRAPENRASLDDDSIDARVLSSGIPIVICFHWILQVQRFVVLGDPERALAYASKASPLLWSAQCHVQSANFRFHESLALAADCVGADETTCCAAREKLAANLQMLERWAASSPSSFAHRHALVAAELAWLDGRSLESLQLHEQAIRMAQGNGFVHDRALACERAAAHATALGLQAIAVAYLEQAREAYSRWGARRKVALLDGQHPALASRTQRIHSPTIEASLEQVDVTTIAKVSRTLSGEIVLDRLVDKLMTIAIEHAGAQRGMLILQHAGELSVEAMALSTAAGIAIERMRRAVEPDDVPAPLLAEAVRDRRGIVVGDACAMPELESDPCVRRRRPRSALCLPLIRRGELIGMLYLENGLASHVFTTARLAVLDMMASQAAISLQNADLYGRLERENAERRQSEEALRKSEERYALAIDAAADGHADWMAESDTFYASPRFLEQWGLPREMSVSRSREMIEVFPFHPDDRVRVIALLEASRDGDARRLEFDARVLRQSDVRWMHVTMLFQRDATGKLLRTSTATTDVTERRRVEEELRISEERYALAVSGSNESIFDLDLRTRSLYLAHRTQELLGIPPGRVRRSLHEWLRLVRMHPEDAPRQQAALDAHVAGLTQMYEIEVRYLLPDGERWLRQRGRALRDEHGKAYRLVGSVGDITERKREQEELLRLGGRLRQAERFEAMGTLASGIAHDFNNILGAILGFGERARKESRAGSRQRHDLDNVIVAGERGRHLVERILAFSRDTTREATLVPIENVVREGLALLRALLPERLHMTAELAAPQAAVLGDATQLHQLVMNLGMNAIQAMSGTGTLAIALQVRDIAQRRSVTVGALSPGRWVALSVGDTGCGIPADILPRVFDPFFTTREAGGGTGLGLSLALRIVTQANGAIDVDSRVDEGSVITVYLPYAGEATTMVEQGLPELPRGRGQRILVVDDEEPLLDLTLDTLRELGYTPTGAQSGEAALAMFGAAPRSFEAVVTDQRMPGMSGDHLVRELRQLDALIPIVLVSGYLSEATQSLRHDGQVDELLTKPLRADVLAACLSRLLPPH